MALDGDLNYSSYSGEQLEEALRHIDRERFPVNHERLIAELERRRLAEARAKETAPEIIPYRFEFRGNASEYFRIWIVNLGLTIVTLGVYSAWAKVRKQRYLYGNTYLAGSAFGYHGEPLRILKGRLIAALLVATYFLATKTSVRATLVVICLIGLAAPWLVVRSRMFACRVTSWRGLRFDFKEDYRGAYGVFLGWLLIGILTVGLLLPRMIRERYRFLVSRTSFGNNTFECNPGVGRFYKTAFVAFGLMVLFGIFSGFFITLMRTVAGPPSASSARVVGYVVALFYYAILGPMLLGYTRARNFTEILSHTKLGTIQFKADFSATDLTGIYISNVFAIVASLGMLTPWAEIRLLRYRLKSIEMHATGSLDHFTSVATTEIPSAAGEEVASFLDLDFGF